MSVNFGPKRTDTPFNEVVFDEVVEDQLVVQGPMVASSVTVVPPGSPYAQSGLAYPGGAVFGTKHVIAPPPSGVAATDQAALNAIVAGGGVFVQLQPGTYNLTGMLTLVSNTTINGADSGTTIITGTFDSPLVGTTKNGTTQTIYSNITISNLTLKSGLGHLLQINNCNGVTVENVEAFHTVTTPIREGLWMQHCSRVQVGLCYVHDYTGDGIQLNHCTNFTVVSNLADGGSVADDGIDIDCDFLDTSLLISSFGTVVGNTIRNHPNGNAIRIEDSQYITVTGNECDGVTTATGDVSGILVNGGQASLTTSHIVVSGNIVTNCVTAGITIAKDTGLACQHVSVTGNNLDNCGQAGGSNVRGGITVQSATDVLIDGNYISNTSRSDINTGAIIIYKGDRVKVSNNQVQGSAFGIRLWNGSAAEVYTDVTVSDNHMVGNTTNYIGNGGAVDCYNTAGVRLTGDWKDRVQFPAFAASPAVDPQLGDTFAPGAMTGAVTVANPVAGNSFRGMKIRYVWQQDGTGGRTITYSGANFRSVGIAATVTTLSTVTIDEATCVDGTIWRVVRLVTGQTV